MKELEIDIETFSSANLTKCGVYRYVQEEDFSIILFGYSVDNGPVKVIDLAAGEKIPQSILDAIVDENVIKYAFNATFERVCLSKFLGLDDGQYLDSASWRCTMIWSAYLGLPLSLEGVGYILGLDKKKMAEGKDLIRYFCLPCPATISNGGRVRNYREDDFIRWSRFVEYNRRDVESEMEIRLRLSKYPIPDSVWAQYHMDQKINDGGVLLDMDLVVKAIEMDTKSRALLMIAMRDETGLENPNSVSQLKGWLLSKGIKVETLGKKAICELLETIPDDYKKALELRRQLAKSSVKKYQAMMNTACHDSRARGMFQFYGANRTGRWSGRNVQLQNLPQNHLSDLSEARALVKLGDFSIFQMLYENVPDTLSQLIRTAFIPKKGTRFIVSDFSAIEARVIAWLAGEEWRVRVFEEGGDIYCASASQMFHVPVVKHGENGHLRQKGKIAELALGYGGSVGALKAMGALEMGLKEEELNGLVQAWRQTNPNITSLWWAVDSAVSSCVSKKTITRTHGLVFTYKSGLLFITLPSGRKLTYVKPRMGLNMFGTSCVTYEGVGSTKKWERIESYGPKFVENIVQAISRDILCYAMLNLQKAGLKIVMHIHDEVVIEAPKDVSLSSVTSLMGQTPLWTKGLVLRADGYECSFYQKD